METELSFTAGALFSGIGGFCLGFADAGIQTAWAVENDVDAVSTYELNFKNANVVKYNGHPSDIKLVSASDLIPVDVLHAGFPCQSFSVAGDRKGFDDPRGQLFFQITRIIREFQDRKPSVLVLENSPNIRNGEGGSWFMQIINEIRGCGYWFRESNCFELDSYDYTHVPQRRKRLFMVAFDTSKFRSSKFDLVFVQKQVDKDLTKFIDFNSRLDDDYYYLEEGNRYHSMISGEIDDKECIYQLRKYLVRVKDRNVCPTLTANMGLGGHNVPFIHDQKGIRKLTEYECLSLQGFPPSFKFPEGVSRNRRYVQIGNSVVPPLASIIAKAIVKKLETIS